MERPGVVRREDDEWWERTGRTHACAAATGFRAWPAGFLRSVPRARDADPGRRPLVRSFAGPVVFHTRNDGGGGAR